jgi:hypothetical protein
MINFMDIIHHPNFNEKKMFWRQESVSILRKNLLCWTQMIELVPISEALSFRPSKAGFTSGWKQIPVCEIPFLIKIRMADKCTRSLSHLTKFSLLMTTKTRNYELF